MQPVEIFVEADDVAGILGKLNITGSRHAHRLLGILSHRLGIDVDCAVVGLEDLVLEAADSRAPLLAVLSSRPRASSGSRRIARVLHRYSMGSESISPRMPGNSISGSRRGRSRGCACARPGLNASAEVLRREKLVQVDRDIGQGERMIVAGDASAKVPKQRVVDLREPVIVGEFMPRQALDPEQRREHVLEHLHP